MVAGLGEVSFEALTNRILGMYPFRNIAVEDYGELIKHLVDLEHLQVTEEGGLIIGLKGENIVGNYRFFAVFPEEDEYVVIADSRQIGKVEVPPPFGERMTLAGRTWEVMDVDMKRKTVYVRQIKGKIKTYWQGGSTKTHNRILGRMRKLFEEDTVYPHLQEGARRRLAEARSLALNAGLDKYNVFNLGGNTVCIFPWLGNIDYYTLLFLIKRLCSEELDIKSIGGQPPNFILIRLGHGDIHDLLDSVKRRLNQDIDLYSLLSDDDVTDLKRSFEYKTPKFDEYIPAPLLKKALITDYINLHFLRDEIDTWCCKDIEMRQ
jgi:ATP-dependent Lhr-like helicase